MTPDEIAALILAGIALGSLLGGAIGYFAASAREDSK